MFTIGVEFMPLGYPDELRCLLRGNVGASVRAELVILALGAFVAHEADVFAH